jgi:hypothetical protein
MSNLFSPRWQSQCVPRGSERARQQPLPGGLSQGDIWPAELPALAWSRFFVPLVCGNVVLATLAWVVVGIVAR